MLWQEEGIKKSVHNKQYAAYAARRKNATHSNYIETFAVVYVGLGACIYMAYTVVHKFQSIPIYHFILHIH